MLDETRTPPPAPPRARWVRRGFWVVTAALLAVALVRHGPGVGSIGGGEAAVVYNLTGVGWLGERPRVVRESGVFFYLPVLHQVVRVRTRQREARVARHVARTRDGVAIDLTGIESRYAPRANDAPRLLEVVGPDPGALDAFVESAIRAAATEVLRQRSLESLTAASASETVRAELEREVGRRLAQVGVELVRLTAPKWAVAGPLRVALAETRATEARTAQLTDQARAEAGTAARRRAEVDARRQAAHFALKQKLLDEVDAARAGAAKSRREAERYAILRGAEGRAVKAELETLATTDAAVGRMRAEGIQARVTALSQDPSGLLDQTIATEVLPKLRAGTPPAAPAETAPPAPAETQPAPPEAVTAPAAEPPVSPEAAP